MLAGFIREDTYKEFMNSSKDIRSLESVHAKMYIVDDWCLITSANLTGAAFSQRYECGFETTNQKDVDDSVRLFEKWWKIAKHIKTVTSRKSAIRDYQEGVSVNFKNKWKLPSYSVGLQKHDRFMAECDMFASFADEYERVTGRNPQIVATGLSLYQEVDYFFNWLYHNGSKPSRNYSTGKIRKLSDSQRKKEILKWFNQMPIAWNGGGGLQIRIDRTKLIQTLLAPAVIKNLTTGQLKQVLNCFHCLAQPAYKKTKILNSNILADIIKVWSGLLHHGDISSQDFEIAKKSINGFGDSATSEIIAWYFPDKYPMINENSRSGMRFFGLNI